MYSLNKILRNKELNPASKLVYIYLYQKAYDNQDKYRMLKPFLDAGDKEASRMMLGTATKEIAEATGITTRTVARAIISLEEAGLVEKIPQTTEIGTTAYNRYKVYETVGEQKFTIAEV